MTTLVTWTPYAIGSRDAEALTDESAGFTTNGTVVGSNALATRDGATSRVEVSGVAEVTTFQLAPDRAVPPLADLIETWWAVDMRLTATPTFGGDLNLWIAGPSIRGTYGDENAPVRPTDWSMIEWFRQTPAYSSVAVDYVQALIDQPDAYFGLKGPTGGTAQVTWIRAYALFDGGDVPMRLMQRGDGLGMGSSRVLGAGTRQSSTRLFGSY